MFTAHRIDREEHSPAAEMFRILRAAGCDTTNEHDLQMGMISYNMALLACKQRHTNKSSARPTEKSRTGRNDPCPCGSGKKYKKCCLDKNRALSADGDAAAPWKFEPEILPRLWDEGAVSEDCEILSRILDRDPAFAGIGFSKDKIASFMEAIVEEDPSFMDPDNDEESLDQAIDDLAFRYVRESGEGRVFKGMKEKLLAAIARAQSKDEVRALATGVCFELMGDAARDPEVNLLNTIFFRKALFGVLRDASLMGKVMDQLGDDVEELRRLMAANDPSMRQKIESIIEGLTTSDVETLEITFEKGREELWNTISAGEFPVPMPFATQLALSGRFELATANGKSSPEDLYEIIEAFSDELIEEDYIVYGQMLDRWLKNREDRSDNIAKAVEMMAGLCAARSIKDLVPNLLVRCGRQGLVVAFDEDERRFIDNCPKSLDHRGFVAEYSTWLASKGYPEMANRLRVSSENCASSKSRDPLRSGELSVA